MHIHGISQLHGAHPVQPTERNQPNSTPPAAASPHGPDELQISAEARLVAQAREAPDIRADRVASIRAEIEAGTYETDEKLNIALDRLLDEIA